jgi:hypothetical protein
MPDSVSKQVRMPEDWYARIEVAAKADHNRSINNVLNMFIEKELPLYEKDLQDRGLLPKSKK